MGQTFCSCPFPRKHIMFSLTISLGNGTLTVGPFATPQQLVEAVQQLTEADRQALAEATFDGPRVAQS